ISGNHNTSGAAGSAFSNLAQGLVLIQSSTISANTSAGAPGASTVANSGAMNLINSTISGNTAARAGGIQLTGSLVMINVTIANNSGIGLVRLSGDVVPQNVMFSGNTANCQNQPGGPMPVSADPAVQQNWDSDGSCQFPVAANFTGDPKIGPLAANGGK